MKKRIYLLITFFISLFVFSGRVEAFSMFLECKYSAECDQNVKGFWDNNAWARWCVNSQNYFVPVTNRNGNLDYYIVSSSGDYMSLDTGFNDYGCWLKDFTDKNCNKAETYSHGPYNIFSEGICPSAVVNEKGAHDWINSIPIIGSITSNFIKVQGIPVGKSGSIITKDNIDETKYVIYSFTDENGKNKQLVAEGYTSDGKYCLAGTDIKTSFSELMFDDMKSDEIVKYQLSQAYYLKSDFWKVHNNYKSRIIFYEHNDVSNKSFICSGLSEKECKSKYNYEVIIDSEDSTSKINNSVKKWYSEVSGDLDEFSGLTSILNNKNFMNTCEKIKESVNSKSNYSFSSQYSVDMFIDDLNEGYSAVNSALSVDSVIIDYSTGKNTSPSSSIVSYIYKELLGIDEFANIAENAAGNKNADEYQLNINFIVGAIKRDVSEALTEYVKNNDDAVDIINLTDNLVDYTELFYTAVMYLDKNSSAYDLNSSQISSINNLKDNFRVLVDEKNLGIYPVVDCETLLGEGLIKKLETYINIFKIAVPILLIGFGVVDFTKAVFSGDEDAMKKSKDLFLKRLIIAVLIFLSPIFVKFLLNIAGQVWNIFSPNSCGLF